MSEEQQLSNETQEEEVTQEDVGNGKEKEEEKKEEKLFSQDELNRIVDRRVTGAVKTVEDRLGSRIKELEREKLSKEEQEKERQREKDQKLKQLEKIVERTQFLDDNEIPTEDRFFIHGENEDEMLECWKKLKERDEKIRSQFRASETGKPSGGSKSGTLNKDFANMSNIEIKKLMDATNDPTEKMRLLNAWTLEQQNKAKQGV